MRHRAHRAPHHAKHVVRRHWSFEKFWRGPLPKVILVCVVAVCLLTIFFRMSGNSDIDVLPEIRERGTVRIGVLEDEMPFSKVEDSATATGFEAELATLIGEQILGGSGGVVYVPVTVKNDLALLSNKDVDLLISRVEVTASNQESYQLSSVYYQDPVMLMTKSGTTLDLSSSETKIGVIPNATIKPMLTDYLTTMGYPALITDISSYPDALQALRDGKINAFCAEQSVLNRYLANDLSLQNIQIGHIDYAIATRNRERDLANLIENALAQMRDDGTLAPLYQKYSLTMPVEQTTESK